MNAAQVDINFPGHVPVDLNGNLGVGLSLNGSITADANIDIKHLPAIHIDPLQVAIAPLQIGIDPLHISIDDLPTIRLGLEPVRCHVPINMAIGFSLFGKNIACIRFFGETQFIAEPYEPNPCEHCSPPKGK